MAGINSGQLKRIWATARQLGMTSDDLHLVVEAKTGKDSLRKLTVQEATRVIDALKERSGQAGRSTRLRATREQLWRQRELANALGWDDPERLAGFIRKYAGVDRPEWQTPRMASNIIEGLKKILAKQQKGAGGDDPAAGAR